VEYVAPRTTTENLLASIWAEVLNVDRVGIYDGFRSLGGSSIQAIDVGFRAGRALATANNVPPTTGNATISEYSLLIDAALVPAAPVLSKDRDESPREESCALSYAQDQVWLLEQLGEAWRAYRSHTRF